MDCRVLKQSKMTTCKANPPACAATGELMAGKCEQETTAYAILIGL